MQHQNNIETKEELFEEILLGLKKKHKSLPNKFLYDKRGIVLFDEICGLPEYYLARTEFMIMKNNIDSISDYFGKNSLLIEFGAGSSLITRLLLSNIQQIAGYIPIDFSGSRLRQTYESLSGRFPELFIHPIGADYTRHVTIPEFDFPVDRRIAIFQGSVIGTLIRGEAKRFLSLVADSCGSRGGLLVGVDLVKNKQVLEAAYNDSEGLTAEFNLNILRNLNSQFNFNFDLKKFYHHAIFNEMNSRIEMYLISREEQLVKCDYGEFRFFKGEPILTGYSHKYTLGSFNELVSERFQVETVLTDENNFFSVQYLMVK